MSGKYWSALKLVYVDCYLRLSLNGIRKLALDVRHFGEERPLGQRVKHKWNVVMHVLYSFLVFVINTTA